MGIAVGKNVKFDPTITIWEIFETKEGKKSVPAKGTASTKKQDGTWDNFDFSVYFVGEAVNKIRATFPHEAKFDGGKPLRIDILNGDFKIDKVQRKKEDGTPITFTTKDGREFPSYNSYPTMTVFDFQFHEANNNGQSAATNSAAKDSSFVNIPDSLAGSEDYLPFS